MPSTLSSGKPTITLEELTPKWLRDNYLTGLTLCDEKDKPYGDPFYETHLMNAARHIEGLCDIAIVEEVIQAEEHDYRIGDYMTYAFMQLFKSPVRRVDEVRAVYPLGQTIQVFPQEWIRLEPLHGQIHLVPSRGSLGQIIIGQGGDFLPLIYGGLSYLPNLWQVDYTAGMDPENLPRDVVEAIAKMAALDVLTVMSDLVRPIGVASESVSIDGLSQSMSYLAPAFQQHIVRYTDDLYGPAGKSQNMRTTGGLLRQIHDQYRGFNLASLY